MAKDRIRVRLRGFDIELIDQSAKAIVQTVLKAGSKVSGQIPLPTRINRFTVLRSPHVNKKSREQFEMRAHKGLIGKKLGMTQIFDEKGAPQGVTVIEVEPNLVVAQRTPEKDGYSAVVLGWGQIKVSRRKKPVAGQFAEGLEPTRLLRELKGFEKECKTGDRIGVEAFAGVGWVDVVAVSKGKGFQGVVKRYHFSGGPKR